GSGLNNLRRIASLFSVSEVKNLRNSPCGSITICLNCSWVNPIKSSIFLFISETICLSTFGISPSSFISKNYYFSLIFFFFHLLFQKIHISLLFLFCFLFLYCLVVLILDIFFLLVQR